VTGIPSSDDELLARLARVVQEADPVPDAVTEAALAALTTRALDAELAELVDDSALGSLTAVRDGGQATRMLSFESTGVTVELQVRVDGATRAVRGLVAGAAGEVTAETPGASRTAAVDAGGWFGLDGLEPGPVRLRMRAVGGATVVTSWVSI
jgi:hypothetical protein